MERAPLLVVEIDADLTVVGCNERAARALQIPRDAALGRGLGELLRVDGGAETWRALIDRADDAPQVVAVSHPQLGRRDLEFWVQPAEDGVPATIFAHDVSERVALAKRRLLESTVLGAVENTLDISVWALDRDGTYLLQEGKAVESAGLEINQFVGRNLFEMYSHGGVEGVRRAIAGESSYEPASELHGLFIENWFVPVDRPGCDAAMVGVTLNVTEARRREVELRARLDRLEQQREASREPST